MKRHSVILAAAAAAIAAAGLPAQVGRQAEQRDQAREARAGGDRAPERNRAPGPGSAFEQLMLRHAYSRGYGRGGAGGYRKKPHSTHKQNRRKLLARRA